MERNDIIRVLEHYQIEYWTSGNNVSRDSINIQCPYCDDGSNHCGIFHPSGFFNCWRCSARGPISYLVSTITNIEESFVEDYIKSQKIDFKKDTEETIRDILEGEEQTEETEEIKIEIPKFSRKITPGIKSALLWRFLEKRNIDIMTCVDNNCYICEAGKYNNRLIIPVYYQGELVSFQGKDLTGISSVPYKTAPGHINEYLYGYDEIVKIMVLVEGTLDKWRTGPNAAATFGTSLTDKQRTLIIDKKLSILVFAWDSDAYWKAKKQSEFFAPFIENITIVKFPEGHDPDSYGRKKTWKLIENSM